MAISAAQLFTGLGQILETIRECDTMEGTLSSRIAQIESAYVGGNNETKSKYIDGLRDEFVSVRSDLVRFKASVAKQCATILKSVMDADNPLPDRSFDTAYGELIRQLSAASESFKAPTSAVASVSYYITNQGGNPALFASLDDFNEETFLWSIPEDIEVECITDGEISRVRGNETFTVKGERKNANRFSNLWPDGSGGSMTISMKDPSGSENLATNGDMEEWSGTRLADWSIQTGTATNFLQNSTTTTGIRNGSFSLQLTDNTGAVNLKTRVAVSKVRPSTKYVLGMAMFNTANSTTSASVRLALVNASGTLVNSSDGYVDFDLSTAHTIATPQGAMFTTPIEMPDAAYVQIHAVQPLPSSQSVYIDDAFIFEMDQFLPAQQGPYIAIVKGQDATPTLKGDRYKIAISNSLDGAMLKTLHRAFDLSRFTSVYKPNINAAGGETIGDGLLT